MKRRLSLNALLASTVAIMVAASGAAADLDVGNRIGGLTGSGPIWTNDALLPSGSGVHAGDEIRTGEGALGVLESPAFGRLEIRPDSLARLDADSVELHRGTVASSRAAVRVRGVRIAPQGEEEDWIVVRQAAGETLVAAYRGAAVIQVAGATRLTVPAGSYALAAAPPAAQQKQQAEPQEDDDDDAAAAPARGAAQAGKKGGWKLGSLASPTGAIVLTGIAAAAVTGVAVTGGTRDEAASPQD